MDKYGDGFIGIVKTGTVPDQSRRSRPLPSHHTEDNRFCLITIVFLRSRKMRYRNRPAVGAITDGWRCFQGRPPGQNLDAWPPREVDRVLADPGKHHLGESCLRYCIHHTMTPYFRTVATPRSAPLVTITVFPQGQGICKELAPVHRLLKGFGGSMRLFHQIVKISSNLRAHR
jgi:hypothetical protein